MNRKSITTGWQKRLRIKTSSLLVFSLIFLFISCDENEKQETATEEIIIAQVGSSTLTESRLEEMISAAKNQNKLKDEIVSEWVESELLYLQAEQQGILEDSSYKHIVRSSSRKIAGGLYLRKFLDESIPEASEEGLLEYYNAHQNEFALTEEVFSYRLIEFKIGALFDSTASLFWTEISRDKKKSFPDSVNFVSKFETRSGISSERLVQALDTLDNDEIVVVPNTEPGVVSIVQLTRRYEPGAVPEFSLVKDKVRESYYGYRRTALYDKLIKELYSEYNVLISR